MDNLIGDTPLFPFQPVATENGNYRTICPKISSAFSRLFSCANMAPSRTVFFFFFFFFDLPVSLQVWNEALIGFIGKRTIYGLWMLTSLSYSISERELVMDLERLKLAKSVKPKKSRDKVTINRKTLAVIFAT